MVQEVEPAYSQFTRSWCFPRHKKIIHGPRFAPSDRLRWKRIGVVEAFGLFMRSELGVVEDFTLGVRNENGAVEVLGFCMWKRNGAVEDSGLRTWSEIDVAGVPSANLDETSSAESLRDAKGLYNGVNMRL